MKIPKLCINSNNCIKIRILKFVFVILFQYKYNFDKNNLLFILNQG